MLEREVMSKYDAWMEVTVHIEGGKVDHYFNVIDVTVLDVGALRIIQTKQVTTYASGTWMRVQSLAQLPAKSSGVDADD